MRLCTPKSLAARTDGQTHPGPMSRGLLPPLPRAGEDLALGTEPLGPHLHLRNHSPWGTSCSAWHPFSLPTCCLRWRQDFCWEEPYNTVLEPSTQRFRAQRRITWLP